MSTRRPKVPQARPAAAGGGSSAGGAAPVRRRGAADPDTISATKPVDGTSAAAAKPAPKPAAKSPVKTPAKPAAKTPATPAAKTAKTAAKTPAKAAAKPAAKTPATAKAPAKAKSPAKSTAADAAPVTRLSRFKRTVRKPAAGTAGDASSTGGTETGDDLRPVPAKAFSGRLLVLAMVTAVVTVLLAPSVSTYLHQRSEIAALEADIAAQEQSATELQSQLDRWADPNYIKQQARERIFLVMPGETRYLVKGEHGVENAEQQAEEEAEDLQWVDALWDSVARSAAAP